jgi:cytoskeletal protein RodZ
MSHVYVNKSRPKTKIIIAVLIVGFLMIVGFLYWQNGNDENTEEPASATQSPASNMSKKEVIDAQELAAVAAISGKTVSGTVTQRPDYVSEIEWQVLQNVTKKQPDNEKKLTNLVNKLLFTKKKQAWLAAGENTDQRRQLARQLLDMIPEQLAIEAIDSEAAKEMETKLAADVR